MGTIWEPWQSHLSLVQKRMLVRVAELNWYILREQGTQAHCPFPIFTPKPSLKSQSQIQNPT